MIVGTTLANWQAQENSLGKLAKCETPPDDLLAMWS